MTQTVKPFALTVTLPNEWSDRSIYTFVGLQQTIEEDIPTLGRPQGFQPNVVIMREEAKGDLETYATAQLAATRNQVPDFKLLEERKLTIPLGEAIARTYTVSINGSTVQQWHVIAINGGWAYTFIFSTLPAMADANQVAFAQILHSAVVG
jgi:hypothetical protein